ncbi:tyrosine-protein phosphatase [Fructilactobacillus myrtifloralis]|uniref:Tyrosine-protein phosphatase n=1 Tax=Fructilactobacillus myrtifloralis TaxID=2940301 RepID=A0ABY5BMG3_9LACO|nr:tyrosine-protein phosphatase [Fructilactobacillus myrtifloralis]USS84770.1 tyrosine-protein phosphatase [Fructilactobacillus myrtifloralis]
MPTSKIVNFRDLGGINVPGGTLRSGRLFRSGQLVDLTDSDVAFLTKDCHLRHIFDFRSHQEIQASPDTQLPGVTNENLDILASATTSSASLEDMLLHADNITQSMLQTYEQLVLSPSAQRGYHTFLTQILSLNEPVLFHCFAGKDRTGFGAALILKLVGASEQQIYADYLKTNELRKDANEAILTALTGKLPDQQIAVLKVALNVDQAYLAHAFATIDNHYGSFDHYLTDALHLDPDFKTKFQAALVQPAN